MRKGVRVFKQAAQLMLPILLLGFSSSLQAQTEVAEKPTNIPQSVAPRGGEETSTSDSSDKNSDKKKGPKVKGYLQYHFNQPIDTDNDGAAPSRFRVQRARVTLEGNVNERVSYELDIDPRSPQVTASRGTISACS
jgi:hypothetical protein